MKKFKHFLTIFTATILVLTLCVGCEAAGDEVEDLTTYTAKFETNGGSYVASQEVYNNECVSRPSDPTMTGSAFDDWYYDVNLTIKWDFSTTINDDITLYAKWIANQYTVTLNSNGGSEVSAIIVTNGEKVEKPTDPTKTDYVFVGWYTDASCTIAYDFSNYVTSNFTLYALWVNSATSYTIKFETNGGSYIIPQTVYEGAVAIRPDNPTLTNYTFEDWYNSEYLLTLWNFDTPIYENLTIYAKWNLNPIISYETGVGASIESHQIDYNTTISAPTITKDGYTFGSWYTDTTYSTTYNFSTPITADVTIYALWYKNPTITFETNGGTEVSSQTITYNTTISAPTITKDGYTFGGWYTTNTYSMLYDFPTPIIIDVTIYARWIINNYSITFNSNSGSSVTTQYADCNTTTPEPTAPTLTGYTFGGWYSDSSLNTTWSFTTAITANITLYAKWIINTYTITFNSNGGSDVEIQTIDYNNTASEPTAPTRTDYTFGGWYTDVDCTKEYSFSAAITSSFTLYAKWTSTNSELPDMGAVDLN